LPAAYVEVLQPFYPARHSATIASASAPDSPLWRPPIVPMTYFTTPSYVDKVAAGSLTTPDEFKLLFHEMHHFRQCMQAGGRNQYAKMWVRPDSAEPAADVRHAHHPRRDADGRAGELG
jgi:hypothetical protein